MKPYGTKTMKKLLTLFVLLFSLVLVGATFLGAEAFSGNKTVNITGIFEGSETFTDSDVFAYGSKVSMDLAGAPAGQTFAFWIVNGIVQPQLAVNYQFTIVNNMNLQVVFTPVDKVVAVFVDVNGGYLGARYVTSGGSANTSTIALPYRPGFEAVDGAGRWTSIHGSASAAVITQNSVFVQNYVDDATVRTVTVNVTNGTGGGVKNFNSIVTLVADAAPGGQKFSHWVENGIKISNQSTYKFTALYDRDITAVYVSEATVLQDEVVVTLSNDLERRPGYHTYVGQVEVPAGYTVVEYGFFIGNEAIILSETQNSNIVRGTNIHPVTNEYVSSISIGSHMSVRAYVVVNDGVTQSIVKSVVNHRYLYDEEYKINFEDLTGSNPLAYTATSLTTGGIEWDTYEAYITSTDSSDKKTGSYSVRLRSNFSTNVKAYIQTKSPIDNIVSISLDYAWYSTHTEGRLFVSVSKDKINWIDIVNGQLPTAALQTLDVNIDYSNSSLQSAGIFKGTPLYIQIRNENVSNTSNRSLNVDNIVIETLYKGKVQDVLYDQITSINSTLVKDNNQTLNYTPIRTGYTFNGWYDNAEYVGSTFDFNNLITSSLTLFAKWTINTYTISFNSNGGSAVTAITQDYNTSVSTPSNPTREGYTFDGWFSDAGLISPYTFSTIPAQNITLFAKWTINQYTISFNVDGGTTVSPITQNYGTAVSAPTSPTKTNYNFAGWYTEATFENEYTFSTMPAQNITLYAKWVDASSTATVTFDSNGGSAVSAQIVNVGEYAVEPTDPTKTGYTFIKWEVEPGVEWNFADEIAEDITLTAVWVINQYTISFNSNGGSSVTAITQDYNTEVVAPTNPTKEGYTFGGWYSDSGLTTSYSFSTMSADNITLYAKWNPIVIYATNLFISEYIEGSSNNKAIEIFNGTGSSVNLSDYSVELYANGASSPTSTLILSGTLAHGDVYVIANSSSNATILALADITHGVANFNGDDSIVLKNNGTIIDIFGQVGFDPGTAWLGTVTTNPTMTTLDRTLVRNSNIISGRTTSGAFDPSLEWTAYAIDTTANLGTHTFSPE